MGLIPDNGFDQRGNIGGVKLPVAIDMNHDVGTLGKCDPDGITKGRAKALVRLMANDLGAGIPGPLGRCVG